MITRDDVIKCLSTMTPTELSELVKDIELKWGVSVTPVVSKPVEVVAPPVELQTEYDVLFKSYPDSAKIAAIKLVREFTGLGLKEAKEFVESLPKTVKMGLPRNEAEEILSKIVAAGCEGSIE